MSKFPMRTVVLMILALFSFVWFYVKMHRLPQAQSPQQPTPGGIVVTPVMLPPSVQGGDQ